MSAHPETAAHAPIQPATAHAHDAHHVKKEVRTYLMVFGALLVGTFLTVAMYSVHFDAMAVTITIAVCIATVKAALVAGFFMHLISERKAIYAIMLATVFFFASMMYLIVWSRGELPKGGMWWEGKHDASQSHVESKAK